MENGEAEAGTSWQSRPKQSLPTLFWPVVIDPLSIHSSILTIPSSLIARFLLAHAHAYRLQDMSMSLRARSLLALSCRPTRSLVPKPLRVDSRLFSARPADPFRVLFCGSDVFSVAALDALLGAEGMLPRCNGGERANGRCVAKYCCHDSARASGGAWREGHIHA